DAKRIDGDALRDGFALSGHPTRLVVVGQRNRYQIMNLALVPDWARGWDAWWDEAVFKSWVFATQVPAVDGDTEDIVRWQRAEVLALSLTVRQVAAIQGATYADYRRHAGRSRMDMPAILYIRELVFRAWRLPDTVLGRDARSWALADTMLCAVTHNSDGVMSADLTRPQDGNGYLIAQGYGSNPEFFSNLDPRRFDLDEWVSAQANWSVVAFEPGGDAGDGIPYLIASAPLFDPEGLLVQPDVGSPTVALNGAFAPVPAEVRACLTLAGERFQTPVGSGYRDGLVNEPGLNSEWVYDALTPGAAVGEILFIDGTTPVAKATAIANALLLRQAVIHSGGYTRSLNSGDGQMVLNGMYDRVNLRLENTGIITETVDFTTERTFDAFQPERLFDRRVRAGDLFPGQDNLRSELQLARLNLNVLTRNPALRKVLAQEYRGQIGSATTPTSITVAGGTGTLKAGTPLWQEPAKTQPVMPTESGTAQTVLTGVTTREGEPATGLVPVLRSGWVMVRVKGPAAIGDSLGRSDGHDYLVVDGENTALTAQGVIDGTDVKLIWADFGGGAGGGNRWG
ncbi:MAG TPA: hypothetical protein VMB21_17620, partial [Candidatus Limnocylindria bacterium]|nr:hypothetical protein [Candidatus Limnocylindria bacterium]